MPACTNMEVIYIYSSKQQIVTCLLEHAPSASCCCWHARWCADQKGKDSCHEYNLLLHHSYCFSFLITREGRTRLDHKGCSDVLLKLLKFYLQHLFFVRRPPCQDGFTIVPPVIHYFYTTYSYLFANCIFNNILVATFGSALSSVAWIVKNMYRCINYSYAL